MNNQEAIETIKLAQAQIEWEYPMDYAAAFDMAISALQMQEAKHSTEGSEELKQEVKNSNESSLTQNGLDTISRTAAIDVLCNGNCHEEGRSCDDGDCPVVREIKALPSAQPEPHWIPVSERLPEPRVDVWVNSDIGQMQGYYEEHIGIWYASFGQGRDYLELIVNAWMPLPEPYRAERRTDE